MRRSRYRATHMTCFSDGPLRSTKARVGNAWPMQGCKEGRLTCSVHRQPRTHALFALIRKIHMQSTCMTCTGPSPAAGGHKRRHVSFLKSYAYTSSVTSSLLPSTWPPYTSICPFPAAAEWCLRAAGQPLPRCDTHAHRRCHCTSSTFCGICIQTSSNSVHQGKTTTPRVFPIERPPYVDHMCIVLLQVVS